MSQWNIYSNSTSTGDFSLQESFEFSYCTKRLSNKLGNTLDAVLPTQGWPKAELSEVHCNDSESVLQLLLPTLTKLNAQNRWISLISPPADINLKLFAHYGIDTSRVLLIHPKNDVDDKATMNKALKNGTSGIVILWTSQLNKRYLPQWRKSVKQGKSTGIIVNMSPAESQSESVSLSFSVNTEGSFLTIADIRLFGIRQTQRKKISFSKVDFSHRSLQRTRESVLN